MKRKDYKRLGDYIRVVDVRNRDLSITQLVGLTINKAFIPSVANVIGTDLSNYKVIRKEQFACSLMQVSRDGKIPVAMFDEVSAIMSPAYPTFEVTDKTKLLPQYLMMWFSRSEFDREASFYAVGGVRGSLTWEDFCDMSLPIPSIEEQRKIVARYNALTNRIKLNEQTIQKLEETAQTLYRKMFVDDIDVENLPEGWRMGTLNDIVDIIDGDRGVNYPKASDFYNSNYCLFLNAGNVTKKGFEFENNQFITKEKDEQLRKGKLQRLDIVLTTRGTVGNFAFFTKYVPYDNIRINSGMVILRAKEAKFEVMPYLFNIMLSSQFTSQIESFLSGSAQPQLPIKDLIKIPIVVPALQYMDDFSRKVKLLINNGDLIKQEIRMLKELQSLLATRIV